MRRFSKVVALLLLLAIVVSVFGILPSFAADAETTYGTEFFNSNTDTSLISLSSKIGDTLEITDDNGVQLYKYSWAGQTANYRSSYIQVTPNAKKAPVLKTLDGTYTKDSDYMVIDFDISTESTYIENLFFETFFHNESGTKAQVSNAHFSLQGDANETLRISYSGRTAAEAYAYTSYANDVWQHITFVYDFTSPDEFVVYFYINGVYSGSAGSLVYQGVADKVTYDVYQFARFRISLGEGQPVYNASTTIANLTMKKFDVGYNGPFTGDSMLCNKGTTLYDIPDLAYCMKNVPDAGEVTPYADVYKADGETLRFTAYKWEDLDANLQDGDIVKLYKGMSRPLLVPKGATITFKDAAAEPHTITPGTYNEGDLVNIAKDPIDTVDFAANKVVQRSINYAVREIGIDLATVWGQDKNTRDIFTLLGDIDENVNKLGNTSYVYTLDLNGYTATLSTSSSSRVVNANTNLHVRDGGLVYNGGGSDFTRMNHNTILTFENVDMVHNAGALVDARGGFVAFMDSTIVGGSNTTGLLVSMKSYAYNGGSTTEAPMSVIVDNTDIDFTKDAEGNPISPTEYIFNMQSYSEYTNAKSYLNVFGGSSIKTNSAAIVYAFAKTTSEVVVSDVEYTVDPENPTKGTQTVVGVKLQEWAKANKHEFHVNIANSTIQSDSQVIKAYVETFNRVRVAAETIDGVAYSQSGYYYYDAEAMDVDVELNISDSDITTGAASVALVYDPAGHTSTKTERLKQENLVYDVDINIDGASKVSTSASLVDRTENVDDKGRDHCDLYCDLNVAIVDGVKLATKDVVASDDHTDGLVTTLGEGASVIAHSALDADYDYVVTSDYTHYTYAAGTASGEFDWNNAEGDDVDMTRFATLAEATDLYYYTWANEGNAYTPVLNKAFKFGVNLTLREDININIFLPLTVSPDAIGLAVDGEAAKYEEVNGQYKVTIKGIDPTMADVSYAITGSVDGAYGDSVPVNGSISIVDYLDKALNDKSDEGDELLQAVLNYVVAAGVYAKNEVTLPDTIAATAIPTPNYGEEKAPATDDVITGVQLLLDGGFKWVINTTATSAKATYTVNGVAKENADVAVTNGTIVLNLKAMDLTSDVTITAGDTTVTFNYAWYANGLDASNEALQNLAAATWAYATASAAYSN